MATTLPGGPPPVTSCWTCSAWSPVVGEVADGINAVWYFAEGNVIDGTLSVAALVPIGGQGATAGKWGRRVLRGE